MVKKPTFIAEDPTPTKRGIQRSKYADWIETAIANPNQWFKWTTPMSGGFQSQIRKIATHNYPNQRFGYSTRRSADNKKFSLYLLAYPSEGQE